MVTHNNDDGDDNDDELNDSFGSTSNINDIYEYLMESENDMRINPDDVSQRIEVAIRSMRVASELREIATHIEDDEALDFQDKDEFISGSFEDRAMMMSTGMVGDSIEAFITAVQENSNTSVSSQFRVDDDDDPLY